MLLKYDPFPVQEFLKRGLRALRAPLSKNRSLPDFLIIGAQKSGTTSLFRALQQSPSIRAPLLKEIHFFENSHNYAKGLEWYRSFFPARSEQHEFSVGEATPFMYHRLAPTRVRQSLPDVKLIVILRDPVKRAFSHYLHNFARNRESLAFQAALAAETDRITVSDDDLQTENPRSTSYRTYGYFNRGLYAEQLERWASLFGWEAICTVYFEHIALGKQDELDKVTSHLGIPRIPVSLFPRSNKANVVQRLDPLTAHTLSERFSIHDSRLEQLLGVKPPWR